MGMPIVVYVRSISNLIHDRRALATYIDSEIEQIEGARVGLIVPCLHFKLSTRQHRHEEIRDMQQDRSDDLFRGVERPDLYWSLRPFPPSLIH